MGKVKVIELSGQKLDPNAKYLFLVANFAMSREDLGFLWQELHKLIGDNFVIAQTHGVPNEVTKVYQFAPTPVKPLKKAKKS